MTSSLIEKSKTLIQLVKSTQRSVFWLGAGFSRCLNPHAPLMSDFFCRWNGAKYPHLDRYLSLRYGDPANVNVEDLLLVLDQIENSPLPMSARSEMICGETPQQIKNELEQFCVERLSYDVPDYNHWAVGLLASANEHTYVITTNYDVLAEQILRRRVGAVHCGGRATCHHCNMRSILETNCECNVTGQFSGRPQHGALLKLHGSIAWKMCENKTCGIRDCLKSDCRCSTFSNGKCDCCGTDSTPVIVLPSAHKTFERFSQLDRMWKIAQTELENAVAITVFGFSFPTSDALIKEMFRAAISKSRNLKEMFIIDVNPEAVADRLQAILPNDLSATIYTLKVSPDGSHPDWLE